MYVLNSSTNIERKVADLTTEHSLSIIQALQKVGTDLSTKIDALTSQESELSSQITKTETNRLSMNIQYLFVEEY